MQAASARDTLRADVGSRNRWAARMLDTAESHSRLANQLRQVGRADEALAHYRRAAELAPDDARAQADLAQMLLSMHLPAEAITPCEQAVRSQPHNPILHLILGDA